MPMIVEADLRGDAPRKNREARRTGMLLPSRSMGPLRRRRDLGLAPVSELHDEFRSRPNAGELLAEARNASQRVRTSTPAEPSSSDKP